mmetsp:Transcript_35054/g.76708  ORF Transcript_35054/g.76708 Transcript_35054/m.76708 type:complete len:267 (-) Transcript_35054:701-1501(-)
MHDAIMAKIFNIFLVSSKDTSKKNALQMEEVFLLPLLNLWSPEQFFADFIHCGLVAVINEARFGVGDVYVSILPPCQHPSRLCDAFKSPQVGKYAHFRHLPSSSCNVIKNVDAGIESQIISPPTAQRCCHHVFGDSWYLGIVALLKDVAYLPRCPAGWCIVHAREHHFVRDAERVRALISIRCKLSHQVSSQGVKEAVTIVFTHKERDIPLVPSLGLPLVSNDAALLLVEAEEQPRHVGIFSTAMNSLVVADEPKPVVQPLVSVHT